jgi:hypothetical protein
MNPGVREAKPGEYESKKAFAAHPEYLSTIFFCLLLFYTFDIIV